MHTIFDVAEYILHKLKSTTAMKLEKLCYYCQAYSLAWDDLPLFNEDFEAWANGPVCPELFKKHRGVYSLKAGDIEKNADFNFNEDQTETMELVLQAYGNKEPHWLSELTHSERPWLEARKGYAPGDYCNVVIDKEVMRDYYCGIANER